ncbi:hypothetical protein HZA98_02525 [Candidatus Woesearchaeota archaeon]|nr:hypothetical protein [Candidatus Woesearchaeota archaeon]
MKENSKWEISTQSGSKYKVYRTPEGEWLIDFRGELKKIISFGGIAIENLLTLNQKVIGKPIFFLNGKNVGQTTPIKTINKL